MDFISDSNPWPLWLVVVTLIVLIAATVGMGIWTFATEVPFHRLFSIPGGLILLVGAICVIVWLSYACNVRELAYTEDVEVKAVTFPDGQTAQMFYAAGKNRNANEIFSAMVPEDSVVRHYVYKKVYYGIRFTEPREYLEDTYTIVKKGAEGGKARQ